MVTVLNTTTAKKLGLTVNTNQRRTLYNSDGSKIEVAGSVPLQICRCAFHGRNWVEGSCESVYVEASVFSAVEEMLLDRISAEALGLVRMTSGDAEAVSEKGGELAVGEENNQRTKVADGAESVNDSKVTTGGRGEQAAGDSTSARTISYTSEARNAAEAAFNELASQRDGFPEDAVPAHPIIRKVVFDMIREEAIKNMMLSPTGQINLAGEDIAMRIPLVRDQHGDEAKTYSRPLPVEASKKEKLRQALKEAEAAGIIERIKGGADFNSQVWLKKEAFAFQKGVKFRFLLNGQGLNAITEEKILGGSKRVPNPDDNIEFMQKGRIMSMFDAKSGYHQMPVHVGDRHKLAFHTLGSTYQYRRVAMGLKHAAEHFQKIMDRILDDDPDWRAYIDDLQASTIVHRDTDISPTGEMTEEQLRREGERHGKALLNGLRKANKAQLRLKWPKSLIAMTQMPVLGHTVSHNTVGASSAKHRELMAWATPKTHKQLATFLGKLNWLAQFVERIAIIAGPLHALRHAPNSRSKKWSEDVEREMKVVKRALASPYLLHRFRNDRRTIVDTDASQAGIGGILWQLDEYDKEYLIKMFSRRLNKAQQNYSTTKRERYALREVIKEFHYYLIGRTFVVRTDHKALENLLKKQKMTQAERAWFEEIRMYDFIIIYIRGEDNFGSDWNSRATGEADDVDDEWDDAWDTLPTASGDHLKRSFDINSDDGKTKIRVMYIGEMSKNVVNHIEAITTEETLYKPHTRLTELVKAIFDKEAVVDDDEKEELLDKAHKAGHYGWQTVVDKIIHGYGKYWPFMARDAQKHTALCKSCQIHNYGRYGFNPTKSLEALLPMEVLHADLGEPTGAKDTIFKFFLVVIDRATRFVWLRPLINKETETVTAELMDILSSEGKPTILVTDGGGEFDSNTMKRWTTAMNIEHRIILPNHPQVNGLAENAVKASKLQIAKMMTDDQARLHGDDDDADMTREWYSHLPRIALNMNLKRNEKTKSIPFALMRGRNFETGAKVPFNWREIDQEENAAYIKDVHKFRYEAAKTIQEAGRVRAGKMAASKDKHRQIMKFKVGDTVRWQQDRVRGKRWIPNCKIIDINRGGGCILQLPEGNVREKPVPVTQLALVTRQSASGVVRILTHIGDKSAGRTFKCVMTDNKVVVLERLKVIPRQRIDEYWATWFDKLDEGDKELTAILADAKKRKLKKTRWSKIQEEMAMEIYLTHVEPGYAGQTDWTAISKRYSNGAEEGDDTGVFRNMENRAIRLREKVANIKKALRRQAAAAEQAAADDSE